MRTKITIGVTTLGLLLTAACGGSGGGNGGTGGTGGSGGGGNPGFTKGGNAGSAIDMTRSEGPAPAVPGAKPGGTITVLSASGLTTMDPTEAYYTNTGSILTGLVTRSLTQYVYDAKTNNMILIPDLATKWSSNSDYTKWTFTLRDGVKYENGDPVTCNDVRYGILRSFDRKTFSGGAAYSNEFFKGGDKYQGPYASGTDYSGVKCSGNTLTILMAKPFPDMPYWGAFPAMGPVPPGKASDPATYKNHPLATGPYMFKAYQPGVSLTLVKNPNWDPKTDPGRTQYPDSYVMRFTEDTSKIDQVLLSDTGSAQTSITFDNIAAADFGKAMQEAQDRLVIGSTPCTAFFAPDYRKIKDINVRKALGYAYPYVNAWKAGGELVGVTRTPGTTILPPGIPGRVNYDVLGNGGKNTDPAKSKALLKKAGETGYEIKFLYVKGDPLAEAAKDQIVKGLTAGGFKPVPQAVGINQYPTVRADPNADLNVRSFGWCSDWPSGGSWFPPVFAPASEGGSYNLAFFEEKSVNDKITQIQQMPLDKQPAAWAALDKYIQTKYYPVVINGYYGAAMMHGAKVGGMNDDNVYGMPTWKDMYVTK